MLAFVVFFLGWFLGRGELIQGCWFRWQAVFLSEGRDGTDSWHSRTYQVHVSQTPGWWLFTADDAGVHLREHWYLLGAVPGLSIWLLPWLFLVLLVGFVYATFFLKFGFVWQAFEGHKKIQKVTLRTPPFDGWCCILWVLRGKLVWLTGDVSWQK